MVSTFRRRPAVTSRLLPALLVFVRLGGAQHGFEQIPNAKTGSDASVERAAKHADAGRFAAALAELNRVLATEPDHVRALSLRGTYHYLLGQAAKAAADHSRALKLEPENVFVLLKRAAAYTELGRHQEAFADRDAAVRLRPEMAETYVARGASYHQMGDHAKGLADRTEAIRLNPSLPLAWLARGNALHSMGRHAEAAADLRHALKLDPGYSLARELLHRIAPEIAGERPATPLEIEVEHEAVEPSGTGPNGGSHSAPRAPAPMVAPPASPTAEQLHERGRELIRAGEFARAIVELGEALRLKPNMPLVLNARGYAYLRMQSYAKAIADFSDAIRLDPKYANAYHNRSVARRLAGDSDGAAADSSMEMKLTGPTAR